MLSYDKCCKNINNELILLYKKHKALMNRHFLYKFTYNLQYCLYGKYCISMSFAETLDTHHKLIYILRSLKEPKCMGCRAHN